VDEKPKRYERSLTPSLSGLISDEGWVVATPANAGARPTKNKEQGTKNSRNAASYFNFKALKQGL